MYAARVGTGRDNKCMTRRRPGRRGGCRGGSIGATEKGWCGSVARTTVCHEFPRRWRGGCRRRWWWRLEPCRGSARRGEGQEGAGGGGGRRQEGRGGGTRRRPHRRRWRWRERTKWSPTIGHGFTGSRRLMGARKGYTLSYQSPSSALLGGDHWPIGILVVDLTRTLWTPQRKLFVNDWFFEVLAKFRLECEVTAKGLKW